MARRSAGKVRRAQELGRPLRDANFLPKRERKAIRKSLIRGYVANKVADARVGAAARAEFYRNLRQIKARRLVIAREMHVLADMVGNLHRAVARVEDRVEGLNPRLVDDAIDTVKGATSAVGAAADEFSTFAKARVWYTEAAA